MIDKLARWDEQLFLWLNNMGSSPFDEFWMWFTTWGFVILAVVMVVLIYRTYGWKSFLKIGALFAVLILLTDQSCATLIREMEIRLRPCHQEHLQGLFRPVRVWLTGGCGGQYGFVSSHAGNAFALSTLSTYFLGQKYRYYWIFTFSFAILIAYSRIYIGVHYPGDVIVGGIVGTLYAWLLIGLCRRIGMIRRFVLPLSFK